MSHSLACCAARVLFQACSQKRCAAARLGWRAPETVCLGFCARAMPPTTSRKPTTAGRIRVLIVCMEISSEVFWLNCRLGSIMRRATRAPPVLLVSFLHGVAPFALLILDFIRNHQFLIR